MFITDSQNSPLKNISDISGQLAYRGQIISGVGGGSSNPTINLTSSASGHYISLLGSGGQTLTSGSLNPIFWTGFQRRNNLTWSNSDPSKLTISGTSEGYYNLSAHINLGINSVFDTYAWVKNGSEILSSNNSSLANVYLSANDYVQYCINSYTGSYISGNCSADIVRIPDTAILDYSTKKFSPLDIPGCVRWYSASSGVLNSGGNQCSNGEDVYIWKNLAQNPYTQGDIYSPISERPIYKTGIYNYDYPVLDMHGVSKFTGIHNNYQEGCIDKYTLILNRQRKFTTGAGMTFAFLQPTLNPNRITVLAPYSSDIIYADYGNNTQRISSTSDLLKSSGDFQILKFIRRKSSAYFSVNNTIIGSISTSSWIDSIDTNGPFYLGSIIDDSAPCNSYFSDFLMYNRDLSAGELSLLDQYLGKYEINPTTNIGSLPENNTGYLYNDGNGNLSWNNQSTPSFTPNQIPGIIRWYSAQSGALNISGNPCNNNDEVYSWIDSTPNNKTVIRATNSPIYVTGFFASNKPALYYSPTTSLSGSFSCTGENVLDTFTVVANMFSLNQDVNTAVFYKGAGAADQILLYAPIDYRILWDAGNASSNRLIINNFISSGKWNFVSADRSRNNSRLLLNGSVQHTVNNIFTTNYTDSFVYIGGLAGQNHNCYYSDIMIFNKILNCKELCDLQVYFNQNRI